MTKLSSLVIATILITGCNGDDDPGDPGPIFGEDPELVEWQAELTGIGPYAAVSGESHVMWAQGAGSFQAGIEIRDDVPLAVRPWHVHFGTCGTGGGIVGPADAYPPLLVNDFGTDSATVVIQARLDPAASYHVNVHLSPDQLETITACGDLVLNGR